MPKVKGTLLAAGTPGVKRKAAVAAASSEQRECAAAIASLNDSFENGTNGLRTAGSANASPCTQQSHQGLITPEGDGSRAAGSSNASCSARRCPCNRAAAPLSHSGSSAAASRRHRNCTRAAQPLTTA